MSHPLDDQGGLVQQLLRDRAVAHLATLTPEGAPHSTPMWFTYQDGSFWFVSPPDAEKVEHIRRDPRVAVSISNQDHPYRAVMVHGNAEILDDGTARSLTLKLQEQYLGSTAIELPYTDEDKNVAIRVRPHTIESWTYQHHLSAW